MQPPHLPDPTAPAPTGANPGYVRGQLARTLTACESHPDAGVRDRAARKVEAWTRVFEGMLSGTLQVGTRVPVAGAPKWATLEGLPARRASVPRPVRGSALAPGLNTAGPWPTTGLWQ